MQPAEHRRGTHISRCLDSSGDGRVAVERVVRARLIEVGLVFPQRPKQVLLPHRDDVIGALASDAANQSFDMGVLPGRSWRCNERFDPHAFILRQNAQARAGFGP